METQQLPHNGMSQQMLEATRRCEAIVEECNSLRDQLSTSQRTINQYRRFQASLKSRMLVLKEKMNEGQRRVAALEDKVEANEKMAEENEKRFRALEIQLAEAQSRLKQANVTEVKLSCRCTHESINDNHRKLRTRVQQVENLVRKTIKRFDSRKSTQEPDDNDN